MRRTSFEDMNCSIAQSMEVIGEWWTPLILRDLMFGIVRFDELQARLGIARNVLTDRLNRLVERDVVTRRRYQEHPERYEYRLTEKGADLWKVLNALREWGDRWEAPNGPPVEMVHRSCGHIASAALVCSECGEPLERRELQMVRGPGANAANPLPERTA